VVHDAVLHALRRAHRFVRLIRSYTPASQRPDEAPPDSRRTAREALPDDAIKPRDGLRTAFGERNFEPPADMQIITTTRAAHGRTPYTTIIACGT